MPRVVGTAVLSKLAGGEDYTWDRAPSGELAAEAGAWLQAHSSSGNDVSVVLLRRGGAQWILRLSQDRRSDNAGRPVRQAALARVVPQPQEMAPGELLVAAYNGWRPERNGPDGSEFPPGQPARRSDDDEISVALLQLALADEPRAFVREVGSVSTVLAAYPRLMWIALLPRALPGRWPDGTGLVLSEAHEADDEYVSYLWRRLAEVERRQLLELDLDSLRAVAPGRDQRLDLLSAALLGELADDVPLSEPSWRWLLSSNRAFSLARAPRAVVAAWLNDGSLGPDELESVADRLSSTDAPLVAGLLGSSADRLDRFLRLFGPGAGGIEHLLPPEAATLWASLQDGRLPTDSNVSASFATLEQAGLIARLSARALAALVSLHPPAVIRDHYERALEQAGLPPELAAALAHGRSLERVPDVPPPEASPEHEELPDLTLVAPALCRDTRWRYWWVERWPPRAGMPHPADPDAGWTAAADAWLRGAATAGEVSPSHALARVARWRKERVASGVTLLTLLKDLGFDGGAPLRVLLAEALDLVEQVPIPQDQVRVLRQLRDAGVLHRQELNALGVACADPDLLELADVDSAVLALIDCRRAPPVEVPAAWEARLDPILAQAIRDAAFWRRWECGVPHGIVAWICGRVSAQPAGAEAAAVMAALQGSHTLSLALLTRVADGLPARALCAQAVRWAGDWRAEDRAAALERVLSARPLPPDLCSFLRERLLGLRPARAPDVPAIMVVELLPILDPIEEVLRPWMSRTMIDADEPALLEALMHTLLVRPPLVRPPPPDPAAAARRPAWTRAAVEQLGWSHWQESSR